MPDRPTIPAHVLCLADYAREAAGCIDPATLAWLDGYAGQDGAQYEAGLTWSRVAIRPRVLIDGAAGSTRLRLLGHDLAHPIVLAPIGYQRLIDPGGEVATARGALDTVMTVSTLASMVIEEIAAVAEGPLWFQLYMQPFRDDTLALLHRAEAAGSSAIVVTLDAPVQRAPLGAISAGFTMPTELDAVHLREIPPAPTRVGDWITPSLADLIAAAPTWDDMAWLREQTRLPLLVKGVLHPDDAVRLCGLGYDGVVVSNHGGRVLDGAITAAAALPAIRAAVGPKCAILVDGGIRSGADVFRALALGADAVMIGRPQIHALAVAGSLGVAHMLKLLREELELTMVLAGCPTIASITPDAVVADRC